MPGAVPPGYPQPGAMPPGYVQPGPGLAPPGGFVAPPPAPKKSKKKLALAIVGGALALCCGGAGIAAISGNDATDTAAPAATTEAKADKPAEADKVADEPAENEQPAKEKAPGLKDPVRDGKFEFTVTKLDCGKTKVGSEYFNQEAQGQYCMVSLTVKNIGDEAQMFTGASQKAYDSKGTEYSNDTTAELYANEDNSTFLKEINPGNQVKGRLIFDVPKSTELTSVQLHDSMFSGGVRVELS